LDKLTKSGQNQNPMQQFLWKALLTSSASAKTALACRWNKRGCEVYLKNICCDKSHSLSQLGLKSHPFITLQQKIGKSLLASEMSFKGS
jgi:hypothetical protein